MGSTVYSYSKKRDGNIFIRPNFQVKEFACHGGADSVRVCPDTVEILQAIRNYFGKPVHVNSGYRTAAYNKKIGGASRSQHVVGTACDIKVTDVPPSAVAAYIEKFYPVTGLGLYSTFVHVDSRGYTSRWLNSGSNVVKSFNKGNLYEKYKAPEKKVTTSEVKKEVEDLTEAEVIAIVKKILEPDGQVPSGWAEEELNKAVKYGITDGSRPRSYARREDVMVMVERAVEKAIK